MLCSALLVPGRLCSSSSLKKGEEEEEEEVLRLVLGKAL